LSEENYLINTGEIGPLGKPILELVQWIMGLYNLRIMNLLEIPHFWNGKNVGLCVKQIVAHVHGGILWMDRMVHIEVELIGKLTGLPIVGAQPKEYLENKVKKKRTSRAG
jgi:uncharacterized membrane protein